MDIELVEPSAPESPPTGGPTGGPEPGSPEVTIDEVDQLLDEVEAALSRLDDGSYGTCRTCGGPIDDHRLAGLPTAQTCAPCDGGLVLEPVPASDADGGSVDADGETIRGPGPAGSPWSIKEFPEV
jgi:hypothetical protein